MRSDTRHSLSDRCLSVLATLIFSLPTAYILWLGLNTRLAVLGFVSVNYLIAFVILTSIIAFLFPDAISVIFGKVWGAMVRLWSWF